MTHRILTVAALAAMLAGCQSAATTGTAPAATAVSAPPTPIQAITTAQTDINTFTNTDLANAITIATNAGAPGVPVVTCAKYVQSQLANLQSASVLPTGTVGVFTAATEAYLGLNTAANAVSPATQLAYATACGPLVVLAENQALSLSAEVTALAAKLAALAPK